MYGAPYIFYFVQPLIKTAKMMVQKVNFERNLKNIRPATVFALQENHRLFQMRDIVTRPGASFAKCWRALILTSNSR